MINLEQVKLLESKIAKAIDYVEKITRENTSLLRKEAELQLRLESYQKRIDELEVLVMGFKEDQSQIEDGILSALDRLNQFEEAIEKSLLGGKSSGVKNAAKEAVKPPPRQSPVSVHPVVTTSGPDSGKICFEIPENKAGDDISDPLEDTLDENLFSDAGDPSAESGELEIF